MFPGNVVLYEQFQHFWLLPSLYVAAKLDIAGILARKPMSPGEISEILGVDASGISRILRALSGQGIFRLTRDGKFALNGMAKGLLDGPGSLRHMILHHLGPVNWNLMSNLEFAVRTGKDPFADMYGSPIYEYLREHPAEYAVFDRSMSDLSGLGLAPVLNAYDFSKFPLIADIGGGEGYLLSNILQNNPGSRGIIFDTPEALQKAAEMAARHDARDRMEIVAGDFFSTVPGLADLYILKNILHNWGDERSVELLQNIRQAMTADAILLVIEMVVPEGNVPSLSKLLDIQMLATMPGGKERTAGEYRALLERSGLRMTRIIPTIAPISLIEATRID